MLARLGIEEVPLKGKDDGKPSHYLPEVLRVQDPHQGGGLSPRSICWFFENRNPRVIPKVFSSTPQPQDPHGVPLGGCREVPPGRLQEEVPCGVQEDQDGVTRALFPNAPSSRGEGFPWGPTRRWATERVELLKEVRHVVSRSPHVL